MPTAVSIFFFRAPYIHPTTYLCRKRHPFISLDIHTSVLPYVYTYLYDRMTTQRSVLRRRSVPKYWVLAFFLSESTDFGTFKSVPKDWLWVTTVSIFRQFRLLYMNDNPTLHSPAPFSTWSTRPRGSCSPSDSRSGRWWTKAYNGSNDTFNPCFFLSTLLNFQPCVSVCDFFRGYWSVHFHVFLCCQN